MNNIRLRYSMDPRRRSLFALRLGQCSFCNALTRKLQSYLISQDTRMP
jgi:hypothetical protein